MFSQLVVTLWTGVQPCVVVEGVGVVVQYSSQALNVEWWIADLL